MLMRRVMRRKQALVKFKNEDDINDAQTLIALKIVLVSFLFVGIVAIIICG